MTGDDDDLDNGGPGREPIAELLDEVLTSDDQRLRAGLLNVGVELLEAAAAGLSAIGAPTTRGWPAFAGRSPKHAIRKPAQGNGTADTAAAPPAVPGWIPDRPTARAPCSATS